MNGARPSLSVLVALALVLVCGGALRLAASGSAGHHLSPDERAYGELALDVARGGQYGDPQIAHPTRWAPGAPVLFGLTARTLGRGGAQQPFEVPAARRIQALLGTLTLAAAFALAWRLAGAGAGLIAAAALALYPPLVTIDHFQLTEPLAALLVLVAVLAVAVTRGPRGAAVAGVLLGLAILTRADLLLAPIAAAAAIWWAQRDRRRAGALAAAALVTMLPWTLFVSVHHGQFIPVSEGGPSNLLIGTYLPGNGTIIGFKRAYAAETRRRIPKLRGVPALKLPAGAVLRAIQARHPRQSPDGALMSEALQNLRRYALGHPLAFAGMLVGKVARMWWRGFHSPQAAVIAAHLLLLATALAGLVLSLRARVPAAAAIAAIATWSTLDNAILVAEPRHNMPLLPALVSVGIAGLAARRRNPPYGAAQI
jgi:4-amino-4-deoxy-L-arabinose transferase-like glycosyltransferase